MPAITIQIPESKFKKGDVLRWKRLVLHVWKVSAHGTWGHRDGETFLDWEGTYDYSIAVQEGFGEEDNPIRPGTFIVMHEENIGRGLSLEGAVKISWDKPIVTPDAEENVFQRWKDWEQLQAKAKEEQRENAKA